MKNKWILFLHVLLALTLLAGCSEGKTMFGKVNELLDQQLNKGKCECEEQASATENDKDATEQANIDKEENTDAEKSEGQSNDVISSVEPKTYENDQGNEVEITYGAHAFVSSVVEYVPGDPAPIEKFSIPEEAVGEPDYNGPAETGFVSLGGGGYIILEFEEVYLIDGPGEDLQIFEIGPAVEAVEIEISKDLKNWIKVGEVSGGTASVDIGPHISKGDQFSYIKLIDLYTSSGGQSSGADIDAVAAVNAILK